MLQKSTDELQEELMDTPNLSSFLNKNKASLKYPEIPDLLSQALKRHHLSKALLARRSGTSEVYLHQLFSGRRKPSRDRLLCVCIGLGVTPEEAQDMLKKSGFGLLYVKNQRDAVILHGLAFNKSLTVINEALLQINQEPLL